MQILKSGLHYSRFLDSSSFAAVYAACESERVEGLVVALFQRRNIEKHEGFRVATQRGHQQMRQFWVPVGYVILLLQQGKNHVAQIGQWLVDVLRFLRASGFFVLETLRSSQIHEVQVANAHLLLLCVLADQSNSRHRMGSWRPESIYQSR